VPLAEIEAGFQLGLLLVKDVNSKEEIPDWSSPEEQVTATDSEMVIRVMREIEGKVSVYVVSDSEEVQGLCVFSGALNVPSKVLQVGDALGEQVVHVALDRASIAMKVFLDEPVESTKVSLLMPSHMRLCRRSRHRRGVEAGDSLAVPRNVANWIPSSRFSVGVRVIHW
jgi:hypothetical protein